MDNRTKVKSRSTPNMTGPTPMWLLSSSFFPSGFIFLSWDPHPFESPSSSSLVLFFFLWIWLSGLPAWRCDVAAQLQGGTARWPAAGRRDGPTTRRSVSFPWRDELPWALAGNGAAASFPGSLEGLQRCFSFFIFWCKNFHKKFSHFFYFWMQKFFRFFFNFS